MNAIVVKAVQKEEFRAKLAQLGADPITESPEYFSKFLLEEIERWGKVVKAAKLKVDQTKSASLWPGVRRACGSMLPVRAGIWR